MRDSLLHTLIRITESVYGLLNLAVNPIYVCSQGFIPQIYQEGLKSSLQTYYFRATGYDITTGLKPTIDIFLVPNGKVAATPNG